MTNHVDVIMQSKIGDLLGMVRDFKKFTIMNAIDEAPQITRGMQEIFTIGQAGLISSDNSVPKAFINYLFFDQDNEFKKGGFKQVSEQALGSFETLSLDYVPEEEGTMMIYTSNQTAEPLDVFMDDMMVLHTEGPIVRVDDYYPFGLTFNSSERSGFTSNKFRFQGQEHQEETGWDSFKWRNHDPAIGRFFNIDPLADDYVYNSPYAFSENHVTTHIELEGLEKVYIFDQAENPDNKRVYTAEAYVESNERGVQGPYRFSSFPNNDEVHNTVNTGEHEYNNESGHMSGTQKGLNIVNADGERVAPGTDPDGDAIEMTVVNVHSGVDPDDNNGLHNRGSAGCPTCHPDDATGFFSNFDFSGSSGNTGNAEGTVTIFRGASEAATDARNLLEFKQGLQNLDLTPTVKSDNTRVATPVFLRRRDD